MRHALLVAAVVLSTVPALAQESWDYHTRAGEWAVAQGDQELAEQHFKAALELAQKLPPRDPRLETSLSNLARLYEYESRFDDAQPMYQLLLAAQEERLGEDHPALLDTLLGIARTALHSGDTPVAQENLERYVALADATGAAEPREHALALSLLARMKTLAEDWPAALELRRKAVEVILAAPGATPEEQATEVESAAQLELLHGDPARGAELAQRAAGLRLEADQQTAGAIGLAEAARTALGAAEPAIARNLAHAALDAAAAAPQDGGATATAREVLAGAAWLEVRRTGELGDLLQAASDDPALAEAGTALATWLEVQRQTAGTDPAAIAETLDRLAHVAAARGDAEQAIRWQRELVAVSGGRAARTDLVGLLAAAGHAAEASQLNLGLIAETEAAHGEVHPDLVPLLITQQRLYEQLGERRDAKRTAKRLKQLLKSLR